MDMTDKPNGIPFAPPVLKQEWWRIYELAQKLAEQENCSLYDMELSCYGHSKTLKIFLEKKINRGHTTHTVHTTHTMVPETTTATTMNVAMATNATNGTSGVNGVRGVHETSGVNGARGVHETSGANGAHKTSGINGASRINGSNESHGSNEGNATSSVGIEDCTRFSRRFINLLDMENILLRGSYHLEVSSPGLERRLRTPDHFLSAIGKEIFISLKVSFSPHAFSSPSAGDDPLPKLTMKNFRCFLIGFSEENLQLKKDGMTFSIPLDKVKKAKLFFAYKKGEKGVKLKKQK